MNDQDSRPTARDAHSDAALRAFTRETGLSEQRIVPRMDEWQLFPRVAVATALAAQAEGLARRELAAAALEALAIRTIREARAAAECLAREGCIGAPPA